jgi:ferredoxin-type protein NapH
MTSKSEQKADLQRRSALRKRIQSITWVVVLITILGGLFYPLLGFMVPVVMLVGLVGGLFKGRYVCGWLCPRGAFFERVMSRVGPSRPIPSWLRSPAFRWSIFALMMGFMVFQISRNPGDIYHWGRVFVRICIITTVLGVVLALIYHPRTWCSFCPMGTLQSAAGGHRAQLYLEPGCKRCRVCEKACPMDLKIIDNTRPDGRVNLRDCLKCSECQFACPKGLLHFGEKAAND